MGRSSGHPRSDVQDPGRRTFLHAGLAGAGLLCMGAAAGDQPAQKKGRKLKKTASDNLYCPVSINSQSNGVYYYSTMQCQAPHAGSSMTSTVRYPLGCGNPAQPRCQPTFFTWGDPDQDDDDEPACRTDRHTIDKYGIDLASVGLSRKLPIDEHFLVWAGQGILVGPEYDYAVSWDDKPAIYVRVALILGTPPADPDGNPRPPVLMGVGQQLEGNPGAVASHQIKQILYDDASKYIKLIRKKDNVHFHILLGRD